MKQDYFIHDGVTYTSGTQIRLKQFPYDSLKFSELAYFWYYDTEYDMVWCKMAFTLQNYGCSSKAFFKRFGGATGEFNQSIHPPEVKQLKDSQIPGLVVGWAWYLVIMGIGIICNDAIAIWIIASVLFFGWRKSVIKEEGHYVER